MISGIVLTNAPSLAVIDDIVFHGKFDVVKAIPAWGFAWDRQNISLLCATSGYTIVRTSYGDGLYKDNFGQVKHPYPNWEDVVREITPWYNVRQNRLIIEIGNEPKDVDISGYAYHLDLAIRKCRTIFPKAKIISTAIQPADVPVWWSNHDFYSAVQGADYIGVHQYAHNSLAADDTRHRQQLNTWASRTKPWAITEYGIHEPNMSKKDKVRLYHEWVNNQSPQIAIATAYHVCYKPIDSDQKAYGLQLSDFKAS